MMKKIYLICPVSDVSQDERHEIHIYIEWLEKEGHQVFCPLRLKDSVSPADEFFAQRRGMIKLLRTKKDHARIRAEVHIWIRDDGTVISEQQIFDLGMALMFNWFDKSVQFVVANGPLPNINDKTFINEHRESFNFGKDDSILSLLERITDE